MVATCHPAFERAEQRVGGHPDVVEEHLGEVGRAVEGDQRAGFDAGQRHVDDQAGDALVLGGVGVGAHVQLTPVGAVPERRPDLLAVDHEVVAVAHGAGAQRREIGAGFRLRHALTPDVVGAHHPGEQRRFCASVPYCMIAGAMLFIPITLSGTGARARVVSSA